MTEKIIQVAESGILGKLQPWQSLWLILGAAFGLYGIGDEKSLIFYAMILIAMYFIMGRTNAHKEAMKEGVIPYVVDKSLQTIKDYLKPEPVIVEKTVEVPVEKIIYVPMTDAEYNITSDNTL